VGRTTSHIRERIVDIHGWVLMRNHYHLLISEVVEGGLTLFLRKLSGYARYFNDRHQRSGTLFQGRTKKILISEHAHLLYILHYIHSNPLDYLSGAKNWRDRDKGKISDLKKALSFLETYRWSSCADYRGVKNFPSLLTTKFFAELFESKYSSAFQEFLLHRSEPLPETWET
jgi:REP element-mobilizing transposase RayT